MTIERLQELVGNEIAGTKVQACEVKKNNGTKRIGFQIGDGNMRPCVYVDDILRKYEEESFTANWLSDRIAERITGQIEEMVNSAPMMFAFDRESIMDGLFVQVINADKNEEMLKRVPL